MSKIIFVFTLLISQLAFGQVKVEVNPKNPVKGESFNVTFTIEMSGNEEPQIEFEPFDVEVLSKRNAGVTTRTTYINGKLTTERTMSISYELLAKRAGNVALRGVKVNVDGRQVKHPSVRIRVVSTPLKPKEIFALAVVNKDEVFVGESILVRYYLYSSTQIRNTDIKTTGVRNRTP